MDSIDFINKCDEIVVKVKEEKKLKCFNLTIKSAAKQVFN